MEKQVFLNNQVANIVGLTKRQVLSYTEKGLVLPFEESRGVGLKRGYNYVNLLEFALCKRLFSIGLGFRAVKDILHDIRSYSMPPVRKPTSSNNYEKIGILDSWANDFCNYHELIQNRFIEAIHEFALKEKSEHGDKIPKEFTEWVESLEHINADHPCSKEHQGFLIYFFYSEGRSSAPIIMPWEIDYILRLNDFKTLFKNSAASIIVDIGQIKKQIDAKM